MYIMYLGVKSKKFHSHSLTQLHHARTHTYSLSLSHTHAHIHAQTNSLSHTYTRSHVHAHTYTYTYTYTYTHTHMYFKWVVPRLCMFIHTHIHTHTRTHTRTHTYAHTHTHTYTKKSCISNGLCHAYVIWVMSHFWMIDSRADSFTCETWLIYIWDMTHVRHDSYVHDWGSFADVCRALLQIHRSLFICIWIMHICE